MNFSCFLTPECFVPSKRIALVFLLWTSLPSMAAQQLELRSIEQLDVRYRELSTNIYQAMTKSSDRFGSQVSGIEQLHLNVQQLLEQNDHVSAISTIHANFNELKNNVNNPIIFELIELLLKHNDYDTASSLYREIENEGDQYFIANAALKFATYHSDRKEWQKTLSFLDIDFEELSSENTDQASILKGLVLQHTGKHRDAVKIYENVPNTSNYYSAAQLNIAIAHIRQDWWTDAHIVIKQLLNHVDSTEQSELANRLHLMLGYSLLGKGYYRESRESFRNISLDSQYTSKALLGIILAAVSQGDDLGALSVLSVLKKREFYELEVEETYLLSPHIYQKLEQYAVANANYTEAIAYYQKRIAQLGHALTQTESYGTGEVIVKNRSTFMIAKTPLKFTELYPEYFLDNFIKLKNFKNKVNDSSLNQKINSLYEDYEKSFRQMIKGLINRRVDSLNSYLSQSHYGLAQLYDKSSE